jgi:hypothetical protein
VQQRKSRFSSYQPNFVGAEPAINPATVESPPAPFVEEVAPVEPSSSPPPRKTPTGKGGRSLPPPPLASSKRVREMSDYVFPFSARLRPDQAQTFEALVRETGQSRVRLLEEALTMLFKHYGSAAN